MSKQLQFRNSRDTYLRLMETLKGFNSINIKMEVPELNDEYPYNTNEDIDLIPLDTGDEMFSRGSLFLNDQEDASIESQNEEDEEDDIIILHIDIREPIVRLKKLLENKIGGNLSRFEFWLQDAQILEPDKNLVDQCVKGEGLVQINVQVQTASKRINIVDVLKPTDEMLAVNNLTKTTVNDTQTSSSTEPINGSIDDTTNDSQTLPTTFQTTSVAEAPVQPNDCVRWVIDDDFLDELIRLGISSDPYDWTIAEVKHWLSWAVRQFNLDKIKLNDWHINGGELCTLTLEEFQQKVPVDPGDTLWTHLELLRKCKIAAVRGGPDFDKIVDENETVMKKQQRPNGLKPVKAIKPLGLISQFGIEAGHQGNRTGNNGQIQLWQFLLEILTDREHRNIISWIGGDGEFKLTDPERVAKLWGERKNKPTMNYEKLSRALRYYYDGDMISKVHGKRFVYKFVCDLTQLIGYDAQQLSNLVNEDIDRPYC